MALKDLKLISEIRWAIVGPDNLYTGQWLTRKDAIRQHCEAYVGCYTSDNLKDIWKARRRLGDRAVKVRVTELVTHRN